MKQKPLTGQLLETVTLAVPHIHGGKEYRAGETIDVTQSQAVWLTQLGIITQPKATQED